MHFSQHLRYVSIALTCWPVENIDPIENASALGGLKNKDLSFPFVVSKEDRLRLQRLSIADEK